MSDLVYAIEAESRGDFANALEHYARLAESGPPLDRVGVFQALARCGERLDFRLTQRSGVMAGIAAASAWVLRLPRTSVLT